MIPVQKRVYRSRDGYTRLETGERGSCRAGAALVRQEPHPGNAVKYFLQRLFRLSGSLSPLNLVLASYLVGYGTHFPPASTAVGGRGRREVLEFVG